jgi:hypothetical protein
MPFVVLEPPAETCLLVLGGSADDVLSLRIEGGARPIDAAPRVLGFCGKQTTTVTVWRKGPGELAVIAAPAKRIGGTLGLTELVARAKLGPASLALWARDEDLVWDVTQVLRASAVGEPAPVDFAHASTDAAKVQDARILALAVAGGAAVAPDTSNDLVFTTCAPKPEPNAKASETVCAQSSPIRWRDTSQRGRAAGALAPLPFWLKAYGKTRDPDSVRAIVDLLALARRLAPDGFDPTVLEAVTETATGADVLGRAGEDAIVVVGVEPQKPFVYTYSDGAPWRLGDEPRVIALPAGKHALLKPSAAPTASLDARRTVVFRRTASPADGGGRAAGRN